ncbi:MAG: PQQ-binding-like beta-propeller repeat protein, partial [Candidatus Poseidoniia archaeon]|nr:PQQ-binding-like beta-propeller repeat protein [Candidatus Poseidoniia archaeon]
TTGDWVWSVAISADGEYIAGSDGKKVYPFDKDSSTPLWNYTAGDYVRSVAISAAGEYIAAGTGGDDDKVYLFGKNSSTPLWSYETGDEVYSVSISADGEYIAAGSEDNKVYLFDKDSSTGGSPVAYSISFSDMSVSLDVRPGASGVGCTEMLISNEGAATIDVDVS